MSRQAERFGAASLTRAAEIMSNGLDQMRGATSPRLLLELMCAQVLLPSASTDEKAFLARLERLERGGGLASAPQPGPQARPSATGPGARPIPPGRQRGEPGRRGRVRDRLRPPAPFPPRGRRTQADRVPRLRGARARRVMTW